MDSRKLIILFCASVALATSVVGQDASFGFATYYADNMVLQSTPLQATLWGYGSVGASVEVNAYTQVYTTTVNSNGTWFVKIGPFEADSQGTTIVANHIVDGSATASANISGVLFGDVWVCSGQSNIDFGLGFAYNASEEVSKAVTYTNIRILHLNPTYTSEPLEDFQDGGYIRMWSAPTEENMSQDGWGGFSAVCILYGTRLYDKFQKPLGLIQSDWGGTVVEAWSPPETLERCDDINDGGEVTSEDSDSALWNAMIHPLYRLSIFGVIWFQGSANAGADSGVPYNGDKYNCTFPTMIEDWRARWYKSTGGVTNPLFPFGFVEFMGTYPRAYNYYPQVRFHQTADYGYAPNEKMPNTFLAVATDLPDPLSPEGNIHFRDKQTVADRLSWAAFNQIYNMTEYPYQGPLVADTYFDGGIIFNVTFDRNVQIRSNDVFSFNCEGTGWQDGLVEVVSSNQISILLQPNCNMLQVAYMWKELPCAYKQCGVYTDDSYGVPSSTWIRDLQ